MSRLDAALRKCRPNGIRRTSFTFLTCIVVPRSLLRTFSTNKLFLVPERSLWRAESWSPSTSCWSCWISSRRNGLIRSYRLRRGWFTFFRINIVSWSLWALNRIIISFTIASQSKGIPNLVLSACSTTSNIYIIKRMLFRTYLTTQRLITPNWLILRASWSSSQINLAFWCFIAEKLTWRTSSINVTVVNFGI